MRRTLGLIVLALAVGAAPAALAQQQPQQQQNTALQNYQVEYLRELAPAKVNPANDYASGVAALKAKQYKQAVRSLGRLADTKPNFAPAWRLLGVAYAGKADWNGSRRAYKRALYLAPDDVISHAGLGAALVALNDPKAQKQAEWLKAKTQACGDTCPEAPVLKALEASGPFAGRSPS